MATSPSDAYRAAAAPHDANTTLCLLDISGVSDAEIALASGLYELRLLDGSIAAWLCPGASTAALAALTSGDPASSGFALIPGDVITYLHDSTSGDGKLHATLADTGTSTLLCTRKGGA